MNTGFDIEKLQYELNALKIENFNIDLTGFDNFELDKIFKNETKNYENANKEIDLNDGEYKEFEHCCPKCGFEFND